MKKIKYTVGTDPTVYMTENYELETKMLHYVDRLALLTAVIIYYWRLYPKLEKKDIIVKRTVENVNG